jgi:hypothetical protein
MKDAAQDFLSEAHSIVPSIATDEGHSVAFNKKEYEI